MSGNKRKLDIFRHGSLYRRVDLIDFPPDLCAYCGQSSYGWDHAPAISQVDNLDVKEFLENGGAFMLYPVCEQCNILLRNSIEHTLLGRLGILDKKYMSKLRGQVDWSQEDLDELGPSLKALVLNKRIKKDLISKKARAVSDNFYKQLIETPKNETRAT